MAEQEPGPNGTPPRALPPDRPPTGRGSRWLFSRAELSRVIAGLFIISVFVALVVEFTTDGTTKPPQASSVVSTTTQVSTTANPTPAAAPGTGSHTATSAAPAVTPAGTLAKAVYIRRADAICKAYAPALARASHASNLKLFTSIARREIGAISKLPPPDAQAATMNQALAEAAEMIVALEQGNTTLANKDLIATDTLVGVFGMKVCNYGH